MFPSNLKNKIITVAVRPHVSFSGGTLIKDFLNTLSQATSWQCVFLLRENNMSMLSVGQAIMPVFALMKESTKQHYCDSQ